ncbi:hypothetical protein SAMN04488063_3126 [Halopelagius inordinatus]|uniref:Uncharacterized protein n=1 Tax=Halopelagius inordinatus TaxID=553467 RepID=A0A1I2V9C2_9EURY|nr:hypothetical protein [Halopelagius inordinatus]SFG85938.1 hypothetical protein SAMN04488063_3126 [Halopelagius inordinatus]
MTDWIDLTQTLGPDCPTRPPNRPAPEFLVEREVACVATDALGADAPGATIEDHVVHRTLLPGGVRIVESEAVSFRY